MIGALIPWLRASLLMLAAAGLVYVALDEARLNFKGAAPAAEAGPQPDHLRVYYFRNAQRCPSCLKFEEYTLNTLETSFAGEMETGRIRWVVVDTDAPENQHFLAEYTLVSKAVVLSDYRRGSQRAWRNLERIWELVDDETAFKNYIRDEVRAMLRENAP